MNRTWGGFPFIWFFLSKMLGSFQSTSCIFKHFVSSRTSCSISCKTTLLAKKFLSFLYLGMSLFHFWKVVLPDTRFLVDVYFFSFRTLNMLSHCFLASMFLMRSQMSILLGFPCMWQAYSSCCFQNYPFVFVSQQFYHDVSVFGTLFASFTWRSWKFWLIFFINFGRFSDIISLTIFSAHFSPLLLVCPLCICW